MSGHKTLGDATNVVVGFNSLRGALEGNTLNNIWGEGEVSIQRSIFKKG